MVIQQLSRHFTLDHKCQLHGGIIGYVKGPTKAFRIYLLGTMDVCTKFVAICLADGELFHWMSENFDDEKLRDHQNC